MKIVGVGVLDDPCRVSGNLSIAERDVREAVPYDFIYQRGGYLRATNGRPYQ